MLLHYTNATKMYIVGVYLCIANDKNLEGFEVYIGLTKQKAEINYSHKEQKSDTGQPVFDPRQSQRPPLDSKKVVKSLNAFFQGKHITNNTIPKWLLNNLEALSHISFLVSLLFSF